MSEIHCYRVWFDDGSVILVNATGPKDALAEADALAAQDTIAIKVECLDVN